MCKHIAQTIVYYDDLTDIGDGLQEVYFTAYQCDDCGMLLREATADEVVKLLSDPPTLDKAAYWNALKHTARAVISSAKES